MSRDDIVGQRVSFAPNPRMPMHLIEATVVRRRKSPNANTFMRTTGWLDTVDDAGIERSVRPSRCKVMK